MFFFNAILSSDDPVKLCSLIAFLLCAFTCFTFATTSKSLARPGMPYSFNDGETARQIGQDYNIYASVLIAQAYALYRRIKRFQIDCNIYFLFCILYFCFFHPHIHSYSTILFLLQTLLFPVNKHNDKRHTKQDHTCQDCTLT